MKKKSVSLMVVLGILVLAVALCIGIVIGMRRNTLMIRHSSEHMVFYCYKESTAQAEAMSPYLEKAYYKAMASLHLTSGSKIRLVLHKDMDSYRRAQQQAGMTGSDYAVLVRETVHVAPVEVGNTFAYEAAAYQSIRALTRLLTNRSGNGFLSDTLAAYAACPQRFEELKAYAAGAEQISAGKMTSTETIETYEAYIAQENYQQYLLFIPFLTEEGEELEDVGALWRVLRAREPCNFARATGYAEEVWNSAWAAWLKNFTPYVPQDYIALPQEA